MFGPGVRTMTRARPAKASNAESSNIWILLVMGRACSLMLAIIADCEGGDKRLGLQRCGVATSWLIEKQIPLPLFQRDAMGRCGKARPRL
ncbi:hypothetical protein D3C71_1841550 [compost metagenome]